MIHNYTPSYYGPIVNNFNNTFVPEVNKIYDKYQEDIPYIFSPINEKLNILELTSLENTINNNINPFYNVKVKKLPSFSNINKDIIFTNSGKKILVLDLDETLVHSSKEKPFPNKKNIVLHFNIKYMMYTIYVILRPFLDIFLKQLSLYYDLYIFTASMSQYAEPLIKIIDKNKVVVQVLNRQDCKFIKGVYFKDLSIFKKDFKDIIIIDNNPISYALNKHNGIPITTWIDNPNDKELLKLIPILKFLSKVKDVRPYINKMTDTTKTKLNFTKVNAILKANKRIKYSFTQDEFTINNNEKKYPKENLKLNIVSNNKMNYMSIIDNNYNTQMDKPIINHPLDKYMIKTIKTVKTAKKIKIINDDTNKKKPKNNFFNKKLRIKDITHNPLKKAENRKHKYNITSIQNNTNIYNISIDKPDSIQNKINILDSLKPNTLEYPTNNNLEKIGKNIFLIKPKKYIKIIRKDALKSIKNKIHIKIVKNVENKTENNLYIKTEGVHNYPIDRVKNNLKKYESLIHRNSFYKANFTKNNIIYKESSQFSVKDFKFNETFQPKKNNRMVVMKILSKPKRRTADSYSNNNSELHLNVRNIMPKKYENSYFDKFPTEKIIFNHRKIINFGKI